MYDSQNPTTSKTPPPPAHFIEVTYSVGDFTHTLIVNVNFIVAVNIKESGAVTLDVLAENGVKTYTGIHSKEVLMKLAK